MNNAPRETLRELVARNGPGLCSDAKRCEGLLRDLCGEYRREINILISALKERVPLDLLAAQGSMPRELLLNRLSKRLEDQLAVTEGAARWAVDSWALALGVVTNAEAEEREREFARANTKPAEAVRPVEDVAKKKSPAGQQRAAPPAPPAQQQQQVQPPRQTPPPTRPANRPPPQTQMPAPARPPKVIVQNPFDWLRPNAPVPVDPDPIFTQAPPEGRRGPGLLWSMRGCVLGCFLLVVLTFVVFVGVPFVLSVLSEEQQQRSVEPGPVRPR